MMNQEDLFKKIGLILNELNNQYEFLAQNPKLLNELELALFHANADFLSDHAKILIKITSHEAPLEIQASKEEQMLAIDLSDSDNRHEDIESITFTEETPSQPTSQLIEEEIFKLDQTPSSFEFILNESSEHERFDFEERSVDELFNRPLSQEEENILAQKRKLSETTIEEPIITDDDEIGPEPFLVSKLAEEELPIQKPTLNDLLASKTDKSVNNNSSASFISDLKQGINLNDKLLYIKELFNGYNLAYAEAIDLANKLPNFEAADNFFKKNYAAKNNWSDKQATVDKFYELLNQRFQ